jgi:RNA polymerase sigma-70 factor (ECF subfamily)
MDNLTLLRSVREPEAPSKEALIKGRAAMFERMHGSLSPSSRPGRARRGIRIAGFSALGVALVVGLVLTNVLGLAGWRGGADPAAAEVLHNAALAAIENSDPIVGEGQYLLVATTAVYSATVQAEDGSVTSFLTINDEELYIPAARDDDWVWHRHPRTPYQTFGPESEAVAEQMADPRLGDSDELLQAPGGAFYGGEPHRGYGDLAALPRDPVQLLNYIYRVTIGQGPSPDGEALVFIADRLRTGVVEADLRAAFYEAAALIPGVEIVDNQATLDGRTGVAIGRDESGQFRQEIIVDPATGQFIGERQVTLGESNGIPAGTPYAWTAVTTSVVDSAPNGGTPNGQMDVLGCTSDKQGGFECPPGTKN